MPSERCNLLLLAVCFLFIICWKLVPILSQYSLLFLLPPSYKALSLSDQRYQSILDQHRFIVIGGPHRGGTTLLWELLSAHPDVAAFPLGVDTDMSEGSFLQSVLPKFNVGQEFTQRAGASSGLGRYALAPDAHMTEQHALNSHASSKKLLGEWGFYWNLSRGVLLEKTPTDMVTSRLLQALLSPPPRTLASFLFITRHPIAVSLAHQRWRSNAHQSVSSLVLHWLASHRVLAADLPHLQAARVLRFEDLARHPDACHERIVSWLRLPPTPLQTRKVKRDTNRKYERRYCSEGLQTPAQHESHCAMAAAFQPPLSALGLGYDVRRGGVHGFQCMAEKLPNRACDRVPASPPLVRALRAHEQMTIGNRTAGPYSLGGKHLLCDDLSYFSATFHKKTRMRNRP